MSGYQVTNPTFAVTLASANNTASQISSLKSSILPSTTTYVNLSNTGAASVIFGTTGGFIGGTIIFSGASAATAPIVFFPTAAEIYLAWQSYNLSILGSQIPPSTRYSYTTSSTSITNPSWAVPTVGSTVEFRVFNNTLISITFNVNPLDVGTTFGPTAPAATNNVKVNAVAPVVASGQYGLFQIAVIDGGDLLATVPLSPVLAIQKLNN